MQEMQQPEERPVRVRLQSLEERLDLLEQVGKGGLPAVRLAGIEFRLDHVESSLLVFREDVNRRFDKLETRIGEIQTVSAPFSGFIPASSRSQWFCLNSFYLKRHLSLQAARKRLTTGAAFFCAYPG